MKIVVTGATGFVGRSLVPILAEAGAELLLVGRDPERVARLFPGLPACGYDELAEQAAGFDILVQLAVADDKKPSLDFGRQAAKAGVPLVVRVVRLETLDPSGIDEAANRPTGENDVRVVTVFVPRVHDGRRSEALPSLENLPGAVARPLLRMIAALTPSVHVSRLAAFIVARANVEEKAEVLISDGQEKNRVYRFVTRAIDLAFAFSVAILLWWALALVWALVRLQSPGPGIFAQRRIGRDGEIFTCYKFRTMRLGTVQAATNQVSSDAVTGLGRFLRKTKLDELPQIWNIFRNEISLVGPRPCLPVQEELIEARRRRGVLRLKPGISGLAQINGVDMSEPERLARWDARYLALQSLLLDLRIMLATATGSGQGDRVAKDR